MVHMHFQTFLSHHPIQPVSKYILTSLPRKMWHICVYPKQAGRYAHVSPTATGPQRGAGARGGHLRSAPEGQGQAHGTFPGRAGPGPAPRVAAYPCGLGNTRVVCGHNRVPRDPNVHNSMFYNDGWQNTQNTQKK